MMKFFFELLCLFLFTVSKFASANYKENLQLILDVYNFYKSSSIIFFYSSNIDLKEESEILEIALYFSKKGIVTLFIKFEDPYMYKYAIQNKEGKSRIQLPMNVIFFTTENSVQAYFRMFDQIDDKTSKYTYPTHYSLIIFMKSRNKDDKILLDFCMKPVGNPINLRFDSLLLVKCYDKHTIQEWYSLTENKTDVYNLATWDIKNGFILRTNLTKYERRGGLKGKSLRIATSEDELILKREGNKLTGFMGHIFELIKESVNFTMDFVAEEDSVGVWNETTGMWTGVISHLVSGKVDLAASDVSLTSERLHHVDCSIPLMVAENFLYLRKPDDSIRWTGYVYAFHHNVWIILGMFILTSPLLLTLMKMEIRDSYYLPVLLSENYVNVWGIFCQQGLTEFPSVTTLRLAYFSVFLLSVILWAAYCASLTSLINIQNTELMFKSIRELVTDETFKIIVLKDSSEYEFFKHQTNDEDLKAMKNILMESNKLPSSLKEAFDMVCEQKVAAYISSYLKELVKDHVRCAVYQIPTDKFDNVGIILQKNSPYTEIINEYIHKLRNFGLINHLEQSYLKTFLNNKLRRRETFTKIGLSIVAFPFGIAASGFIISLIILSLEIKYSYFQNSHISRLLVWRLYQFRKFILNDKTPMFRKVTKTR